MMRAKNVEFGPGPRPTGSWLAGMMIGSAIMTMAASAMVLGAGRAVKDASMKGR